MNKNAYLVDKNEVKRVTDFVTTNARSLNDAANTGDKPAQFIIRNWPAFTQKVDAALLGEMIGAIEKYKKGL